MSSYYSVNFKLSTAAYINPYSLIVNFMPSPNKCLPESQALRLVNVQRVCLYCNVFFKSLLVALKVT